MELSIYDIIVGPVLSNKAYQLQQKHQKVSFQVHTAANKPLVKEAVSKLFNVKVESVRIVVRKGKRKVSRTRNESFDNLKKIAVVTLQKGHDINLFGNVAHAAETQSQGAQNAASASKAASQEQE